MDLESWESRNAVANLGLYGRPEGAPRTSPSIPSTEVSPMKTTVFTLTLLLALTAHARPAAVSPADDADDALHLFQATVQNGEDATADETIAKVTKVTFTEDNRACSGTLIASDLILTAGHCVPATDTLKMIMVHGFGLKATQREMVQKGKIAKVSGWIRHPDYKIVTDAQGGQTAENDIALVRLSEPLTGATVALLPRTGLTLTGTEDVTIAGWGVTSSADRQIEIAKRQLGLHKALTKATQTTEKTIAIKGPRNLCSGDSGGPSFLQTDKGLVIIGVHSSSNGCFAPGIDDRAQATDTFVPFYTEWIKASVKTLRANVNI